MPGASLGSMAAPRDTHWSHHRKSSPSRASTSSQRALEIVVPVDLGHHGGRRIPLTRIRAGNGMGLWAVGRDLGKRVRGVAHALAHAQVAQPPRLRSRWCAGAGRGRAPDRCVPARGSCYRRASPMRCRCVGVSLDGQYVDRWWPRPDPKSRSERTGVEYQPRRRGVPCTPSGATVSSVSRARLARVSWPTDGAPSRQQVSRGTDRQR